MKILFFKPFLLVSIEFAVAQFLTVGLLATSNGRIIYLHVEFMVQKILHVPVLLILIYYKGISISMSIKIQFMLTLALTLVTQPLSLLQLEPWLLIGCGTSKLTR